MKTRVDYSKFGVTCKCVKMQMLKWKTAGLVAAELYSDSLVLFWDIVGGMLTFNQ